MEIQRVSSQLLFEGSGFRLTNTGRASPQITFDLAQPPDSFCDIIAAFCFAPMQWNIAGRRICFGEPHTPWKNSRARVRLEKLSLGYQKQAGRCFQFAKATRAEPQEVLRPIRRGDHHP
jgi:hypothetical protein